jgi:nucleoside-diphosphate-sugar epimerase
MILVTGATGTVGRSLIDLLSAADVEIRAVTRKAQAAGLPMSRSSRATHHDPTRSPHPRGRHRSPSICGSRPHSEWRLCSRPTRRRS